ncbi:MAG: DnaD domain protein [Candidatus Izemoplasmatales bacterium]
MEGLRSSDRFQVFSKAVISSQDYQTLTLFYQPIIGQGAFVLYCTLIGLLDRQNLSSKEYLHSDLEALLNQKISVVETDRFKLEAIGLMDTFYQNDSFLYEMKMPLPASQFVNDGVLGEYLIHNITKDRFKKVMDVFKTKRVNRNDFLVISKSFDDVFESIKVENHEKERNLISQKRTKQVSVTNPDFDFRTFEESLPKEFDLELLTHAVKDKISNLAYVYGLSELDMKIALLRSVDETMKVVKISSLAVEARNKYKELNEVEKFIESVDYKKTPEELPKDPTSYFKVVPPHQLLKELGDGLVSTSDLRIAERLIEDIGLDKGVVNVLLAYTYQIKNGILPSYEYFEKVGMGWKRNQITSVELAMDYIKHLQSEFERRSKEPKKKVVNKKPDIEIDWLDEYYKSI